MEEEKVLKNLKTSMLEILRESPGVCGVTAGPGARPYNPKVPKLFVECYGRVSKTQRNGYYLPAALKNVNNVFLVRDDSGHFFIQAGGAALYCPELSAVASVFQSIWIKLESRRLPMKKRATMASRPCDTLVIS